LNLDAWLKVISSEKNMRLERRRVFGNYLGLSQSGILFCQFLEFAIQLLKF